MRAHWIRSAILLIAAVATVGAQPSRRVALVGGTLIDGYGSTTDSQLASCSSKASGSRPSAQVGTLAVPPGAEVISTEGMSVLARPLGHARPPHDQRPRATTRIGTSTYPTEDGHSRHVIMPASAQAVAHGRRHERARSGRDRSRRASPFATRSTRRRFPARRCTSRDRSFSTSRIPAPSIFAGA